VQDVVPREPDEMAGVVRARPRLSRRGLAEDDAEGAGPERSERRGGRERQVDLEAVAEHERAVRRRARVQVEVVHGAELADGEVAPVAEHVGRRRALGDAEEQVDVRPAVLGVTRSRAGDRRAHDARVGAGALEEQRPHRLAAVGGEQSRPPDVRRRRPRCRRRCSRPARRSA
jgi:hypothetical protein